MSFQFQQNLKHHFQIYVFPFQKLQYCVHMLLCASGKLNRFPMPVRMYAYGHEHQELDHLRDLSYY